MSGQTLCPGCGKTVDLEMGEARRCPSCGETVPSDSPAQERPESISVDAVRKTVRQRLGKILRGLAEISGTDKEAAAFETVVESLQSEIASGCGPNGEELDFNQLANQLSFMIRPLNRSGHDQLAEEVTLVQQTLERLAMVAPKTTRTNAAADREEEPDQEKEEAVEIRAPSSARLGPPSGAAADRTRRNVVIGAVFAVSAVVVVFFAIRGDEPAEVVVPPVQPAAIPAPISTEEPAAASETPEFGAFHDYISSARLAVQDGDPETAAGLLDLAGAITREKSVIFETAAAVALEFSEQAVTAMKMKRWKYADALLARALDVDYEYGIPTQEVDAVIKQLSRSKWDYRIAPDDVSALIERIEGVEATVELVDGSAQAGVVQGIVGSRLHLEGYKLIGGGKASFDAEIELSSIEVLRFTLPANLSACEAARKRAKERRAIPEILR